MPKNNKITWTYCQNNSDKILADAIWELLDSTVIPMSASYPVSPGVYLFSNSKKHYYIGQADNIRNRVRRFVKEGCNFRGHLGLLFRSGSHIAITEYNARGICRKLAKP